MKSKSSQPSTSPPQPARLRDIKVSARDQLMIDPRQIAIEKNHNPRNYNLPENRAHLDELKSSIKEQGTLVPLLVRWDVGAKQCVLVDGECRLRANLELIDEGVTIIAVPTVQVAGNNEADRLITSLTANTGKPLSKWEIGTAFQKLIGWGWDTAKIATRMGYTERYVKESLELSDAPDEVKQLLSQQAVTPSLALQHIRVDPKTATKKLEGAIARAKSKARKPKTKKNGNPVKEKPVTAKREKKSDRVSFTKQEALIMRDVFDSVAGSSGDALKNRCNRCMEIIDSAIDFS